MSDKYLAPARAELNRLIDWLFAEALPFWSTQGVDPDNGFIERFTSEGRPMSDPRRARLIGRQIYSFATAARLGWSGPCESLVRHGLVALDRGFFTRAGTVIRSTDELGRPRDMAFDLYDQAFVLFGLAAAHRHLGRSPELAERALRLLRSLANKYAHPEMGFEEAQPRILPLKANPHMHLFEAALAWIGETGASEWHQLADMVAELCLARFLSPTTGAVAEYYDGDWRPVDTPPEDVIEPGHQFEWAWLLMRWGEMRERPDALAAGNRLIALAETFGIDRRTGLAVNELAPDLSVRNSLARLWPQTERIKAHVAALLLADRNEVRIREVTAIVDAAKGLRRYFEHRISGTWCEHIGPNGRPLDEPSRASSLYHIICAAEVLADGIDRATFTRDLTKV